MQVTDAQIRKIIKENPQKDWISAKRKKAEILRMYRTGENLDRFIYSIPYFEREELRKERVKMARSTTDLLERTMRPRNRMYTAKGGIEKYTFSNENLEPQFREYLEQISDGLTLKDWIRQKLEKAYDTDPEGLLFVEVDEYDNPYPCIKSINEIYYYRLSGRRVECVFFSLSKDAIESYKEQGIIATDLTPNDKVWRVVDDMYDRIVIKSSKSPYPDGIQIITLPNPYAGMVPAMVVSDIYGYDVDTFQSPIETSAELINAYIFSGSTFNISYARTAYPKEWMQEFPCPTCKGEQVVDGAKCQECGGKGILVNMKVSDTLIVDFSAGNGNQIPNPPMGHVETPVEGLAFMRDNLEILEDKIQFTQWGVTRVNPNTTTRAKEAGHGGNVSATAYEAKMNKQPEQEQMRLYSGWMAGAMTFIANMAGKYKYGNTYKGCAILGGDVYDEESSDATWDRYSKAAATDKTPFSVLDSLLVEYYQNKYSENPLEYRKAILLMKTEPFLHKSYEQIAGIPEVPLIQKLEKLYFDDWTSTLTDYDVATVGDDGSDILREMLRQYVTGKYVADKQYDTMLYTNNGMILDYGEQAIVLEGKEQSPEDAGRVFKVVELHGNYVGLQDDTGISRNYRITDLRRPQLGPIPSKS